MIRQDEDRAARAMTRTLIELDPGAAADVLDELPPREIAALLEEQSVEQAAAVVQRLRPGTAVDVLVALGDGYFQQLVPVLEPARAAAVLARLDAERRAERLGILDPRTAGELTALMTYPSDSAGSLMDPRATMFRPDTVARDALKQLRALRQRISDVFVVDGEGRLIGAVSLQELAVAEPATALRDLAQGAGVAVPATAPQAEVVAMLEQSRATSLPVVDFDGRVIGVIRHQALVRAAQADATADLQAMVGVSREERALSGFGFAVRRRLPWLSINLVTAFAAAAVVGMFEGTIARFTALAVLLPVVAGQSGNTGAQALAVTMRGLALREITPRRWLRVVTKEILAGGINGLAISVLTGAAVLLWSHSVGLAFVIGLAMIVSMTIAAFAGASVPIVLAVFGQDPASASSIILTTVTDVVGFLSFLGLATVAAGML